MNIPIVMTVLVVMLKIHPIFQVRVMSWIILRSHPLRINVSIQLHAACRRYAIPEFAFHGLRRLRVDTLQRQGIEPAVYEQIMGQSVRMAKDIYRTPNANDLQGVIKGQSPTRTKASEGDIIHLLIEKLGLSMEEALRRLIGD